MSGPSGAGKTTLLKLLYAALPVQRGQIELAGFNLNTLDYSTIPLLRRQVSVVFQDFKILPDRTVYENVALPLEVRGLPRHTIERRVRAVCRGLGLESRMNIACGSLSGGEQQRVAIARAIVNNPAIVIADEPTGNLDPETSWGIMDIFRRINLSGTTIVMATHDKAIVDTMKKRVIAIEDGRIVRDEAKGVYGYEN